jgi:Heparinase II/III-like protein
MTKKGLWQKPLRIDVAQERVDVFSKQLLPVPKGLGRQIDDRDFWNKFKASEKYQDLLDNVEELNSQELPEFGRTEYLKDWNDGSKDYTDGLNILFKYNLKQYTMVECAENKGLYLARIEQTIKALCKLPSWTRPDAAAYFSNDPELFLSGERNDTDLQVAHLATELATTYWMLKEHLSSEILKLIVENLRKRVFEPFKLALKADPNIRHDWVFRNSNWNAVCLSGVLIPALTVLDNAKERAFYLAGVEESLEYYINSFTTDGFLDEGLSYWGYGIRYFLLINEIADLNTDGKFHWLVGEHIFNMLTFSSELELKPGVFCSYADSVQGEKPYYPALAYVSRKYGLGIAEWEKYSAPEYWELNYLDCSLLFEYPCRKLVNDEKPHAGFSLPSKKARSWFPVGGLFISRSNKACCKLGVSVKGGNNGTPSQIAEWSHKHLDLGSFEIALGDEKLVVDPGVMRYDSTTFGKGRWDVPVHSSYGHNLPQFGGVGQREGSMAKAKIIVLEPGTSEDRIIMDLSSAYSLPELVSFTREYIYDRSGSGSFTVIDKVDFTEPKSYNAAIMTYGKWEQTANGLTIVDKCLPLKLDIDSEISDYKISSEIIPVDMRINRELTRICISLNKVSKSLIFKMVFSG